MTLNKKNLIISKIKESRARIGIVGLGYVGLPLACAFAQTGLRVTGFDISSSKIKNILSGQSYIPDIPSETIKYLVGRRTLTATNDPRASKNLDVLILCVPTPLRKTRDPDISYILRALDSFSPHLHKGMLIILESTTYPGTTREILLPNLSKKLGKVGHDFFLAFSPERIDPGQTSSSGFNISNTPKIVGGITSNCTKIAAELYGKIVDQVVPVSSAETAEMIKILENTFRAVNIGLANEMALVCHRLGLDVWEVIRGAETKPFGFSAFYPGPGLGGHCIPVDPKYLTWKMHELNFHTRFINLADEINSKMPEVVVDRLTSLLNKSGKPLPKSKVLILGVAYKKDTSDIRESPSIHVFEILKDRGVNVSYSDPYVPSLSLSNKTWRSQKLTSQTLRRQDIVILLTNHSSFDISRIAKDSKYLFDTRGSTYGLSGKNISRL